MATIRLLGSRSVCSVSFQASALMRRKRPSLGSNARVMQALHACQPGNRNEWPTHSGRRFPLTLSLSRKGRGDALQGQPGPSPRDN